MEDRKIVAVGLPMGVEMDNGACLLCVNLTIHMEAVEDVKHG